MKSRIWMIILLTFVLILSLSACGQRQTTDDWQQQYDLGIKYLSEGNYEEAILAFTAAIKIDHKQVLAYVGRGDAYAKQEEQLDLAQADYEKAIELDENNVEGYLGLADVYIRRGDFNRALEIISQGLRKIGDERLRAKKEELEKGNIFDSSGQVRRMSTYDESGTLIYYHDYSYKRGKRSGVTSYNASGVQTGHVDLTYNEQGRPLRSYYFGTNDGVVGVIEHTYDSAGNEIKRVDYDIKGKISNYFILEYDSSGHRTKETQYSTENELLAYSTFEYDGNGREIKKIWHDSNGTMKYFTTSEYNSDGKRERYSWYTSDGALEWYEISQYDDDGKLLATIRYGGDGNILFRREFK